MEDVLAVYTRPRDPDRPLVCLDETSKQLIAETRVPIPMKPGRPARCDYEYERNGTANLFMMFAPLEGWRHVKVTDRHTAVDYAHVLKELADTHFADAKVIVLVQDNLNIHSKASLYEAFPAAEARRLVERFEWHYTPKHGSWLDLAESELGVLSSQCLDRRIPEKQILIEEVESDSPIPKIWVPKPSRPAVAPAVSPMSPLAGAKKSSGARNRHRRTGSNRPRRVGVVVVCVFAIAAVVAGKACGCIACERRRTKLARRRRD